MRPFKSFYSPAFFQILLKYCGSLFLDDWFGNSYNRVINDYLNLTSFTGFIVTIYIYTTSLPLLTRIPIYFDGMLPQEIFKKLYIG